MGTSFDFIAQTYGSVVIALVTLAVTVLYTSLTRKLIKTEEKNLQAQYRLIDEQREMFSMERTPYMVFEHKAFNIGYIYDSPQYKHRIDTYFKNVSKVRICYHFEDFKLSSEDRIIAEMGSQRQKRDRYILPDQERHHFSVMADEGFNLETNKWHFFEYTLVYESCEDVHDVKYKSRRKIRFKPEQYGSAENIYLRWSVLSEYDGPYGSDTGEECD